MKTEERTPLAWPEGFPRTKNPGTNGFGKHTTTQAIDEIIKQLQRMEPFVESCIISANGFVRSAPADKGVAVYFKVRKDWNPKTNTYNTYNTESYVIPCDRWQSIEHNFWAVAKHLEAMRGQRRWGCGSLERDFMGYKAIAETTSGPRPWYEVLGVTLQAPWEIVERSYRERAKSMHPDKGGTNEEMVRLNIAYEAARQHHRK